MLAWYPTHGSLTGVWLLGSAPCLRRRSRRVAEESEGETTPPLERTEPNASCIPLFELIQPKAPAPRSRRRFHRDQSTRTGSPPQSLSSSQSARRPLFPLFSFSLSRF